MTAPMWVDAEWSPFGIADEPVYEHVVEFGVALAPEHVEAVGDHERESVADVDAPELDATGAPIIEWAPATREQIGDGDIIRVTQVGTWRGTRLTGKVTTYERRTPST